MNVIIFLCARTSSMVYVMCCAVLFKRIKFSFQGKIIASTIPFVSMVLPLSFLMMRIKFAPHFVHHFSETNDVTRHSIHIFHLFHKLLSDVFRWRCLVALNSFLSLLVYYFQSRILLSSRLRRSKKKNGESKTFLCRHLLCNVLDVI